MPFCFTYLIDLKALEKKNKKIKKRNYYLKKERNMFIFIKLHTNSYIQNLTLKYYKMSLIFLEYKNCLVNFSHIIKNQINIKNIFE